MGKPPSVAEFMVRLGERVPWSRAASWDPVGLQLGDPGAPVRTTGICHEVTEAVAAAVEAEPVDLLVSYHPLLFRPTRSLIAGADPAGRALRLLRSGVALGIVHTSFDVAEGGCADALAVALELADVRGFAPLEGSETLRIVTFVPAEAADPVLDAVVAVGAGSIGAYTHCSFRGEGTGTFFAGRGTAPVVGEEGKLNREPEVRLEFTAPRSAESAVIAALIAAHPYEEPAYDVLERRGDAGLVGRIGRLEWEPSLAAFAELVARALGEPPLRVAGDASRRLATAAVVPGAGGEFISQALAAGADVLVTGDLTHHRVREALDRGLSVIDPGHVPTERPGVEALLALVASLGPACRSYLDLDPDPWTEY